MNSLCLDTFFIDFGKIWLLRKSPEISGNPRKSPEKSPEISGKTKPLVFYLGAKFSGDFSGDFRRFPEISGDFRRRSMSSLGHQKIMKSEDVKIGNIIILQSRCYLGCGEL